MRKIRTGNDFWQTFQIKENGVEVDLLSIKETVRIFAKVDEHCFQIPSELITVLPDGLITLEVKTEIFRRVGRYEIIVKYIHDDPSMSDDDRKQATNFTAFAIVGKTEMADESEDIPIVSDILIGLKGDKGDPFTYEDFTPEQLEDLQKPLTNFVAIAEVAENQREQNEGVRVDNENIRISNEDERILSENTRVSNESDRVDAEIIREQQEQARQANTAIAITNAENAIVDVNTAKDDYYDVVKPAIQAQGVYAQAQGDYAKQQGEAIQGDLALKANHGYDSSPKTLKQVDDEKADHGYTSIEVAKTLKQVEDNSSVKIENLVVNGDFKDGYSGWASTHAAELIDNRSVYTLEAQGNGIRQFFTKSGKFYLRLYIEPRNNFRTVFYDGVAIFDTTLFPNNADGYYSFVWENNNISRIELSKDVGGVGTAISKITFISLTETFGAGNEPTKEEMDLLISTLGTDYFEGEITIPAQKNNAMAIKINKKNKNAIIALGGTII